MATAAAVIGKPDYNQHGLRSACSACGTVIDKLSVHQGSMCTSCDRQFCNSCYKLKEKLEIRSAKSSSDQDCMTCDKVVAIKQNSSLIDEKVQNGSECVKQTYPVKPPRSLHGISSLTERGEWELGRRDQNTQDNDLSKSDKYDFSKSRPIVAGDKERFNFSRSPHYKRQRNRRGLFSVSGIQDQDDNRNYLLFEQEQDTTLHGNVQANDNVTRLRSAKQVQNRPRGSNFSDMKHETNMHKTDEYNWDDDFREGPYNKKQDKVFRNMHYPENDEATIHTQRRARNERDTQQQGMRGWGPEEYQHTENSHQYRGVSAVRSENKSYEFPQNSQFHNETIHYPTPNKPYSNSGKKQLTYSSNRFQESNSSDNPVGSDDTYIRHERRAHGYSHGGGNSGTSSTRNSSNWFYDDNDFEDLDDVPRYSDIPYALILTGNVDEKMIRKSMKKEEQLVALEKITGKSGKKSDAKAIKKNKNQSPASTRINASATNTFKDQVLDCGKLHSDDDVQANDIRNVSHFPLDSATGSKDSNIPSGLESYSLTKGNDHTKEDKSGCDTEIKSENTSCFQSENMKMNDLGDALTGNGRIKEYKQGKLAINKEGNASFSPFDQGKSNTQSDLESRSRKTQNKGNAENKGEFGKGRQNNTEQKSAGRNEVEKLSEEESNTQKSEREIIREKRLKNINTKQINNISLKKPHAVDRREVAFNSDSIHKPVKSKAFRSKIPYFKCDQKTTDEEAGDHKEKDWHKSLPPKLDSKVSAAQSSRKTDDKGYPLTTNSQNKKDQPFTSCSKQNNDGHQKDESKRNTIINERNESFSKDSNRIDVNDESEENDDGVVPIAMKLLKKQEDLKKSPVHGSRQEEDEGTTLPYAMRILMSYKDKKNKKEKLQETSQQEKTGSEFDSILNMLSSIGETSTSFQNDTSPKITELDRSSEMKQPKKNKNKNVSPVLRSTEESGADDKRNDSVIIFGATKQPTEEGTLTSQEIGMEKYTLKPLVVLNFAENRHKAFKRIKMSQSEDCLKCTACGRPECQGHNIKKMKEIIRIAKQAGFEVRDVIPDGNCMFAAVVDQLQLYGDYNYGPKSLREAAVSWLIEHPLSDDGTHFSSFLDEDWNSYLQRMMNEGEWGDHLILRAIVDTIGHTIKVLNVSGEESRWTILEPATIDASKDGMHLVLGHVGEFHYTSLRPADKEKRSFVQAPMSPTSPNAIGEEKGQIPLEGTETIEMFREDYIDMWSDMPSVHFSYLLKRIIPIKVLDDAAVILSRNIDKVNGQDKMTIVGTDQEFDSKIEYSGSIFEGVYVPYLNETINTDSSTEENVSYDMYAILKDFDVVAHKTDALHDSKKFVCEVETSGVHVGYTKILRFDKHHDFSIYQPRITPVLSEGESKYYNRYFAIRCPFWPDCAKSWMSRVRREGWPSKEIIISIESDGCLLLPNAHKESKCPDIEWQFCFALCEKKLFRDSLSVYQKYGYILFSAFCTQTMRYCQAISSTHLKSVFFYACERIPAELWESCPGACVLYMLDELLRYVKTKNLPNYFISTNNMIDYLTDKDLKEIEEQIILLRSQPVLFLRQINESLQASPNGNFLIDKIVDDFPRFKEHRSFKMSTLEVFIPATIDTAQYYIRSWRFEEGYDFLSQAFQERLSVSTCDDSVPFQMFLPGAVSGLNLDTLVWFSAYTDRQLEGQLSKSLIRETCGDLKLVKIKEILPGSVVGSYGDTEVPCDFSKNLCSFCHDFAKFLYMTNKLSEILPILYHCHDIFVKKSENMRTVQMASGQMDKEVLQTDDFTDETMFAIYTVMFTVYKRQHQMEFFRAVMPVVKGIVERIHTRGAYNCLCCMYKALGDNERFMESSGIYYQLPDDPLEETRLAKFLYWPSKVYTKL